MGSNTTGFSWTLGLEGMMEVEEGGFEERGVEGEERSSIAALGELLYLMSVLPKQMGSSGDCAGVLGETTGGGGGEVGWNAVMACSNRSSWSMV